MLFRVRCTCGRESAVAARAFGRRLVCSYCKARRVIVWGVDPKSKKATPITLEATEKGFNIPFGMFELPCPCGQRIYARPRETGRRLQCPICVTWLKLEHSKDSQTLETRIRVLKSRLNQLPALPRPSAAPRPPAATNVQQILCSCGESFSVASAAAGSEARCPACGTQLRLEVGEDSETSCIPIDRSAADGSSAGQKRGMDEDLRLDDFRD